ncbi:hypothetical protein SAMN04488556_0062 [Halostagnicola kamekurae]|uniref:Uncharacterized protein n=1 Tax=Halostagnicola kamekurae TaxID=619731 RepID=A0A1I6V5H3_9EURY|nr:hypothetical protein SAMN04488556_0062 [Halostagnicola kamekurae]
MISFTKVSYGDLIASIPFLVDCYLRITRFMIPLFVISAIILRKLLLNRVILLIQHKMAFTKMFLKSNPKKTKTHTENKMDENTD